MKNTWEIVKLTIKNSIPDHTYGMWIKPLKYIKSEQNSIKISCPNVFSMKRIKENYFLRFEKEFSNLGHDKIKIEFLIDNQKSIGHKSTYAAIPMKNILTRAKQMPLPGLDIRFNSGRFLKKGFTFKDFVVGENSNFAYSASLSLARGNFSTDNMLYLLSGTGLGKSHLAQSVGHYIMSANLSEKVYYVTAEDFTNEMIFSLKNNTIDKFKSKYRKECDVLILEDIHFLSGKMATQKELAITLDYLLDADKKIIFSGCYLPGDIPKLDEHLKSRLDLGLITEIDVPNFATRVRILKKKAKSNGFNVPNDVTDYLAQELCDNVRQLESGLNGVVTKSSILGKNIDMVLAKSVLANLAVNRKKISVGSIKRFVCKEFSVSEDEIISSSRKKRIVKPRQMAIYLSRKYTDQPLQQISRSFNKYHTTAIHSINAVEKELIKSGAFSEQMKYLIKRIEAGKI
ncbi:MAG: chromosomal replication initiator protein DnaA [Desulfobacteraceae bacterium]|nr:chromosomal replication initiator protein DnaA [Desulfobacteraceae bacterium]